MTNTFQPTDDALLQFARALRATNYRFTTVTPATHERVNARPQNTWARDLADVFGWSRPFHSDIVPPSVWELMQRAEVVERHDAERHEEGWRSRVRFSTLDGQLFVHSAYPTVDADAVFFGPDTYRYAGALKHHFATDSHPVQRAIDIGCGAGPGAILTAANYPRAQVLAVDINHQALRFARINAALAEVEVEACHSNLLSDVSGQFDLMVANPPYLVDPSERAYRHGGGPLGAGLSLAIVDAALERLAPNGTLLLYTGVAMVDNSDPFRSEIERRLPAHICWSYQEIDPDVFGEELLSGVYTQSDRIAAVVLTITKR
jgi:methylase of polypeptide subunit release factors